MWCTRWFLPLVILPLPTAPPYFLAVFLVSLFLHARPCFYCMVLLTALFTSSCYWQALPVDAPLTRPLGNSTTFGDAIRANLSSPTLELPPVVQLIDRCWCNVFSRGGLFEPADVSAWEQASVLHAQRALEMQNVRIEEKDVGETEANATSWSIPETASTGTEVEVVREEQESATQPVPVSTPFSLRGLRDLFFPATATTSVPKYRLKTAAPSTPPIAAHVVESSSASRPEPTPLPTEAAAESQHIDTSSHVTDSQPSLRKPGNLLRGYYDLRPYGLDITLDFRWNR